MKKARDKKIKRAKKSSDKNLYQSILDKVKTTGSVLNPEHLKETLSKGGHITRKHFKIKAACLRLKQGNFSKVPSPDSVSEKTLKRSKKLSMRKINVSRKIGST